MLAYSYSDGTVYTSPVHDLIARAALLRSTWWSDRDRAPHGTAEQQHRSEAKPRVGVRVRAGWVGHLVACVSQAVCTVAAGPIARGPPTCTGPVRCFCSLLPIALMKRSRAAEHCTLSCTYTVYTVHCTVRVESN